MRMVVRLHSPAAPANGHVRTRPAAANRSDTVMPKPLIPGDHLEDFPTVVYRRSELTPTTRRPPPPPASAPRWSLERKLVVLNLALGLAVLVEWFVF
jgi:hypothetical protein